jgi:hypothetical protein
MPENLIKKGAGAGIREKFTPEQDPGSGSAALHVS